LEFPNVKIVDDIFEVKISTIKMLGETQENKSNLYEARVIFKSHTMSPLHSEDRKRGDKKSVSQGRKNVNAQNILAVKFPPKKDTLNPPQAIVDKQAVIAKYPTASPKMKDE
jgi:hypothetical protein